jgi:hypothetical protein
VRTELLNEGSGVRITMVHLPAVNTRQFGWCLNRLPNHSRPVPPVYAPRRAADAIVAAASNPPRKRVLGGFNTFLVLGDKLAAGIVDHYVARTAVASQQTDDAADPDRPVNLWEPVDDDRDVGAHTATSRTSRAAWPRRGSGSGCRSRLRTSPPPPPTAWPRSRRAAARALRRRPLEAQARPGR